jgi:hypothetical protein
MLGKPGGYQCLEYPMRCCSLKAEMGGDLRYANALSRIGRKDSEDLDGTFNTLSASPFGWGGFT